MAMRGIWSSAGLAAAVAMLGGCVAAAPLSVAPGQGKSYADLQRDDAACRTGPATTGGTTAAPAGNYYQCMAAKGEMVVANRTVAYPYAAYPYPYAYGYPYAYPYGYPYYGYGYPAAYLGLGLGFGFGEGFYHGGFRGGDFHGGDFHGGNFHGGESHGGGFHH